jgi:chromosome segregation ATPase
MHNLHEEENIWEIKSRQTTSGKIQEEIKAINEQLATARSAYEKAKDNLNQMIDELAVKQANLVKEREQLQQKFLDLEKQLNKFKDDLTKLEEDISCYTYAQIVVQNSPCAQFCLGHTLEERTRQQNEEVHQCLKNKTVNC